MFVYRIGPCLPTPYIVNTIFYYCICVTLVFLSPVAIIIYSSVVNNIFYDVTLYNNIIAWDTCTILYYNQTTIKKDKQKRQIDIGNFALK